ncbi:hypothetical protein AGMMS49975_15160 [Clostridia bacterium]|nr:hypothetical protein AGMMS49975_15160 [Clostridia bacterium]GHU73827.1 hypothetical protein FACS1894188_00370 [Clostridia bacterium]
MLTEIFYYNHYKPYILKNYGVKKIGRPEKITRDYDFSKAPDEQERFVLNHALKSELVEYAKGLSSSVNSLRESAKDMSANIKRFSSAATPEDKEYARYALSLDLEYFAESYNVNVGLDTNRTYSDTLQYFVEDSKYDLAASVKSLSEYAFDISEDGSRITFDKKKFDRLGEDVLKKAGRNNRDFFEQIYKSSTSLLKVPLAEHLGFKDLSYYYNYKLGTIEKDSFKYIQSGMLVNIVV